MEKKRIVITGIGVVAPNGIGKEEFWSNCLANVSGIKPITLFDTSRYRCRWAGEISKFQPETYLGPKGLRNLDRTTLLALVAAKMALIDATLESTEQDSADTGVVIGSTMGSVHSISEFDREGLHEGPRYVNPAEFPNTVINSPASRIAIHLGFRGLNATISTGFTASLDAMGYALDMLRLERVRRLLVGGVEELCLQTFLGFYKLGFLAVSKNGAPPAFQPFGPDRAGALLGEGATFFMFECLEDALARQARIYAECLEYATEFTPRYMFRYDPTAVGLTRAISQAVKESQLDSDAIDFVGACANSTKVCDASEMVALENIFGSRLSRMSLHAVKSLVGESFSAGAGLQLAAALGYMNCSKNESSETEASLTRIDRGGSGSALSQWPPHTALIDAFGPMGAASSLVICALDDEDKQ